jgi:EAL domain-containing protein (putative c-di-GMP-specific phosphodiesterase class I)
MAGISFRAIQAAAARAQRAGLLPFARDLAEDGLAAARDQREVCGAILGLSGVAVRLGQLEEARRHALSGLRLAERLDCRGLQWQFRLDLAEGALLGMDPETAREQLRLVGGTRNPALLRRLAELRAFVAVSGARPDWLSDHRLSPGGAMGGLRAALDPTNPGGAPAALRRALGQVVGAPRPLLALELAHLSAAAAEWAEWEGRAATAERLRQLARVGFRLFRLSPGRLADDGPPAGREPADGRAEPGEAIGNQIAHWTRLNLHLLVRDPSAYFHSVRVAQYASSLCRLAGADGAQRRHAAMLGLLHHVGVPSDRRRLREDPVAPAVQAARQLGLPPAVVESFAAFRRLLRRRDLTREHLETVHPVVRAVAVAHAYDRMTAGTGGRPRLRHLEAVYRLSRLFGLPEPHVSALRLATAEVLRGGSRGRLAAGGLPEAAGERAATPRGRAPRRAWRVPPGPGGPADATRSEPPAVSPALLVARLAGGGLRILFQPIVDLRTGAIHGYEALARGPAGSAVEGAERLFAAADRAGVRGWLVDLCVLRALESAAALLGPTARLFLNVDLEALPRLLRPEGPLGPGAAAGGIAAPRVVVEVSEQKPLGDTRRIGQLLETVRRYGYSLAMDDFGAAYSGYRQLLALEPEYIKLDLSLVRGIDGDRRRATLVDGLARYGRAFGVRLVAEGVETPAELRALRELGVPYGQGYLFAPPAQVPPGGPRDPEEAEADARDLQEQGSDGA